MPETVEYQRDKVAEGGLVTYLNEVLHEAVLNPFYRFMAKFLIRVVYRPTLVGFEQIPDDGPAVLIANHVSYLDGLMLNAACNRPVRYVIDKIIYKQPGVHYFMSLAEAIPIYPKRVDVEAALDTISLGLQKGDLICIFPEGRLTHTGNIRRFRPGIEHIVERDPVPVYPIAIHGLWGSIFSRKYQKSKHRWWPRSLRSDVRLVCGAPIPSDEVTIDRLQREVLRLLDVARKL